MIPEEPAFFDEEGMGGMDEMVPFLDLLEPVTTFERVGLVPGRDLNGRELNRPLSGDAQLAEVYFADARLNDEPLEVYLDGSGLLGVNADGHLSDVEMVGTLFDATLEDGTAATLSLNTFSMMGGAATGTTIYLYEVSYVTREMEQFEPLCGLDETGYPIQAIALAGTWDLGQGVRGGGDWIDDPGVFTFACRRYALAKCVEAGYAPWDEPDLWIDGSLVSVPLRPQHQACTRMMRADYCGDGTSYTVDGTPVNFYDDLGLRTDALPWDFEAEWDEDGALCASTARIARALPECADQLAVRGCGDFSGGALLLSEVER